MLLRAEFEGVRYEYFDYSTSPATCRALTGWYWLDETNGVWCGPFKCQHDAYEDCKKAELLRRPI